MKHYGDITKINGATVETVDIICGGSPCQDLSIAGKRAGLAGERSGLFMDQIRIIKEMRRNDELHCGRTNDTVRCRFMVWENVAGAFSSNNGEDFRAVLEETVRVIDKNACVPSIGNRKWPHAGCIMGTVDGTAYSVAWRLHDAQFWGVPQRRKRIALVADFGGTAAPEILFECESMSGDLEQGEQTRQGASDNSERSIGETSKCLNGWDVQSKHVQPEDGIAEALYSGECRHDGGESYVLQNKYTCIGTDLYNAKITGDKAATFTAAAGTSATHSGPTVLCVQGNAIDRQPQNGPCGKGVTEDVSFTLNTVDKHAVAYRICSVSSHSMQSDNPKSGIYEADVAPTVDVSGGNPACNQGGLVITNKVAFRKQGHPMNAEQGQSWEETEVNGTLNVFDNGESRTPTLVLENHPADSRIRICEDGVFQTLSSRMGTGGNNVPMVMEQKENDKKTVCLNDQGGQQMHISNDVTGTLRAQEHGHSPIIISAEPYTSTKADFHARFTNDGKAQALTATDYKDAPCVAYGLDRASYNQGKNAKYGFSIDKEKIGAQTAMGPGAVFQSVVRRLTPKECERLQGFPDDLTNIGDWKDSKGKLHKGESDSPRYKALGNSIALPFWEWLAERIAKHLPQGATMASLFDGIGGFPLVFSRCGVRPVWASEIEEFPIAVTKKHFPEE